MSDALNISVYQLEEINVDNVDQQFKNNYNLFLFWNENWIDYFAIGTNHQWSTEFLASPPPNVRGNVRCGTGMPCNLEVLDADHEKHPEWHTVNERDVRVGRVSHTLEFGFGDRGATEMNNRGFKIGAFDYGAEIGARRRAFHWNDIDTLEVFHVQAIDHRRISRGAGLGGGNIRQIA